MAGVAFPTWAYNTNVALAPQIVASQAALTALGSGWSTNPSAPIGVIAPADPGLTDTDIRLQQILVEARIQTLMMAQGFGITDDPTAPGLRADVLSTDAALTS